jgi:hypothetical protein
MLLLLVGCLDPISNRLFFEDAEFLDALPSADDDRVRYEATSSPDDGEGDTITKEPGDVLEAPPGAPSLLVKTVASVNSVNAMVDTLLGFVDAVRELPPSSREEDARTWGPWPLDNNPGYDARMVSSRRGVGEFAWSFEIARHGTSSWSSFFSGAHVAGATVREGLGNFAFDGIALDAIDGSPDTPFYLEVDYDHWDGNYVTFTAWSDSSAENLIAKYVYNIDLEHAGDVTFDTSSPDFANGEEVEHLHVTTRWVPDVGGRGDAVVSGGNVEDYFIESVTYTQCWLPDGTVLYMGDLYGIGPQVGKEKDCTVAPGP